VGLPVNVPMSTFYNVSTTGEKVSLVRHFVVRNGSPILSGFATLSGSEVSHQLAKIFGVDPRTALRVLSGMSVAYLEQAITTQEFCRWIKVLGIDKKLLNGCYWGSKASSAAISSVFCR
jgi:Holliday junction DNA helicase RuvA